MDDTRELKTRLAELLRREHAALGDFLVALAEFDRERRWVELGYTSLFHFLHRELGLSRGSAFYRKTAAELIQRYPDLVEPLRDGRLCITSVVELAKVITPENRTQVVPRFFHASKAEAREIAAELRPMADPPRRDAVTALEMPSSRGPAADRAGARVQPVELLTNVKSGWPEPTGSGAAPTPRSATQLTAAARCPMDGVEPLTGDLRRLHVTVSRRFLDKLAAARDALSHSHPGATTEAILEAALDLLLAKDEKKKALVKTPRAASTRPSMSPRHVPAAVKGAVWIRDGGQCQWPVASGGVCGSTLRLELDHIVPLARGGASTLDNLRVICGFHNQRAAREAFGDAWMDDAIAQARGGRREAERDAAVGGG